MGTEVLMILKTRAGRLTALEKLIAPIETFEEGVKFCSPSRPCDLPSAWSMLMVKEFEVPD